MYLTDKEKRMLNGDEGSAVQTAMEILVGVGKAFDAERMVEVSMVHIPSASIVSSKDIGLEFTKEMYDAGGRCQVPTTLNTSAIDEDRWEELGIPEDYHEKQRRYTETFKSIGAIVTHTCTPFLVGMIPTKGEHIAWGEATAATFANSAFGARTNLTGGPEALAASITGRAPFYGLHLDENRRGNLLIKVDASLECLEDFKVAAYYYAKNYGMFMGMNWVPVWSGLPRRPSTDEFKALSYGSGLFHVIGYTPEARTYEEVFQGEKPRETIVIDDAIIRKTYEELCEGSSGDAVDFVMTGCPHSSITELGMVAILLSGKRVNDNVSFWVCTSSQVKKLADQEGYSEIIEGAGATMVSGTCPALAPMHEIAEVKGYKTCAANNGMTMMIRARGGIKQSYFGTLEDIVAAAITGKWEGQRRWKR